MTDKQFLHQINRLIATYGESQFRAEKIRAIKEIFSDAKDEWLSEVVDSVIETSRNAPTPSELRNGLLQVKKSDVAWTDTPSDYKISCFDCYDTGFIYCKIAEQEPVTVCFCHCSYGSANVEAVEGQLMPQWEKGKFDEVFGFVKLPFPIDDFKPDMAEVEKSKGLDHILSYKPITKKLNAWMQFLSGAYAYWKMKNKQAKTVTKSV